MKAKAVAYFVFREVIEDVHAKYKITDEEMMAMNKKAVNRAAAFLSCLDDEELTASFVQMMSLEATGWDNPKETADTKRHLRLAGEIAEELRGIKGKTNREVYGV